MKVSVSTNPAENNLLNYVNEISSYTDFIHCDVMDGIFVPNICLSAEMVKYLNNHTTLPLDVHLMVAYPEKLIDSFLSAGANIVTVHYESYIRDLVFEKKQFVQDLDKIKKAKCLCGISINPNTHINVIKEYLNKCDVVLIMSVNPGLSGQTFIPQTINKITELYKVREENKLNFKIEVDGGVNPSIAQMVKVAGADIVVSGNFVYNALDKQLAIDALR